MTYLQTSRRPFQTRNRSILILFLIIIACSGLIYYQWPNLISGFITAMARPFWRVEFAAEGGAFHSQEILLRENEELRRKILEGEIRLASVSMLETENAELKKILGRSIDNSTTTEKSLTETNGKVLAAVLERPPVALYDELIIDQGNDAGFKVNDRVYAPGNVLIGYIANVLNKTSKIILFSSPQNKYEVMIGKHRIPVTAFGRGGGQYEAQVARDTDIKEGDFVDAPSIADKTFGIVTSVISESTKPFEIIIFAPPVNVYELRWVLVEKQSQ